MVNHSLLLGTCSQHRTTGLSAWISLWRALSGSVQPHGDAWRFWFSTRSMWNDSGGSGSRWIEQSGFPHFGSIWYFMVYPWIVMDSFTLNCWILWEHHRCETTVLTEVSNNTLPQNVDRKTTPNTQLVTPSNFIDCHISRTNYHRSRGYLPYIRPM